jgi:ABC-2 type transport system ATP-binding protein
MRLAELLEFFGELRGLSRREARRRGEHWLDRLGLGARRKSRVQELSRGMQQKVQFAAALLHEPDLCILDEPWSGLDPINADILREVVLEQRGLGRTVLFSTHLMEQAEKICDHVCIIARGEKVLEGPLDRIKREAAGDRLLALKLGSAADEERARSGVLSDRAMVSAVRERRGYLEVELAAGELAERLLSALVDQALTIRRFELVEPTLHQIFVDRVGA